VSGDESDQRASKVAFGILHRELDRRMAAHQTTVVDATNVTSFARRALTRRAERRGIPAIAIVLDLDPEVVHARNAARPGRVVPAAAVDRQLASLTRSLDRGELAREGFAVVHRLSNSTSQDALSIAQTVARE
jgi:predicted kinase